jgi:hypothetical protein
VYLFCLLHFFSGPWNHIWQRKNNKQAHTIAHSMHLTNGALYSKSSVARYLNSNKSAKCTPLTSLKVNHSNINLSQITVETSRVVKPSRETLLDDEDEYFVPETQGNPTLGELNVLNENDITVAACPKVVQRLIAVSYPRPQ